MSAGREERQLTQTLSPSLINLKGLDLGELQALVSQMGEAPYRAGQIMRWIYQRDVEHFDEMTDLSKELRHRLSLCCRIERIQVEAEERSADGTRKFLFRLHDGAMIEAVWIPDGARRTACVSSQAGCGIGCPFCATALGGLARNLTAGEIVDQVLALSRLTGERITHVVFMGMGEPCANYQQVIKAARLLTDPLGYGLGARHITISTSGIAPAIRRFAQEKRQFVLAVSLHAATDDVRDFLVPLNRKYPVAELLAACREYTASTRRRVTFEYVMIRDVNDGLDQALTLSRLLKGMLCHVNLIPLNPVPESGLDRSRPETIHRFAHVLREAGIAVTVRRERGSDIQAACGQLRRSRAR